MPEANLTCFNVGCGGEFEYVEQSDTTVEYRCQDCSAELTQTDIETVADLGGPIGKVAEQLQGGVNGA